MWPHFARDVAEHHRQFEHTVEFVLDKTLE
jgi:hypothetical protein